MSARAFPTAAVIPAAGAGTRFGGPKAEARIPGTDERFVDVVARTAREAGCDPVVVVLPPGVAAPPGTVAVVNPRADDEQIASVRLGFAPLTGSVAVGALLWPVDHPFPSLESVLAVLDGARRSGAPIVVPVHEGHRGHPTWFARDAWRELMVVPQGGARAVVRADPSRVLEVVVRDVGVRRDIDTPDDLRTE